MAQLNRNRSKLLLGCGTAALAIGLVASPQAANAQAIQATETEVSGSITRTFTGTGTETIMVNTDTAVVDWTPDEDGGGNALDYLPTNNTVLFRNGPNNADFAILNRILPSTNGNIVVFDGTVLSQLFDTGTGGLIGTGGTVAFYSPTGIFVGDNAVFDVGNLILTSLEPDTASFDSFALSGGTLALGNTDASPQSIIIQPGAQINALEENSYFIVASAEIQMFGSAQVNGSHAYIGGELVNITVSNGLFDIQIPAGSSFTTPVVIDGDVGGPSSTGPGDNHMIYAVAAASTDPISMIFRGNLGFAPAASAGIVNGEIILSANYNVSGRNVDGGSVDGGTTQVFDGNSELTDVAGSIFLEGFDASSTLLAIANEEVQVSSFIANSSVDGDLLIIGRRFAELTAAGGFDFQIDGDVLVSARAFGEVGSSFNDPNVINAQGGDAFIDAFDGDMTISGTVVVTASALAGVETVNREAGTATGGFATIASGGGSLNINGNSTVDASASQPMNFDLLSGGDVTAGIAQVFASNNGTAAFNGHLTVIAEARGASTSTTNPSVGINAFGGFAILQAVTGGAIQVDDFVYVGANAVTGTTNSDSGGGLADAGDAQVFIQDDETIDILGDLTLEAFALGGDNVGGVGGDALGGGARVLVPNGGALTVGEEFIASADAFGGNGVGGGDAFGGIAGAQVVAGSIDIDGNATVTTEAIGGQANQGLGGDGGDGTGGNSFLQANGLQVDATTFIEGRLTIGGSAIAFADGRGGEGGDGDGANILAGRGGNGTGGQFGTPNQADPQFGSGAFVLAGGDIGNLTIVGGTTVQADGHGGNGGNGGLGQSGGDGGTGTGGTAQAGLALLGGDGSNGQGTATFDNISIFANGFGGGGGNGTGTGSPFGNGGDGFGFDAFLTARAGTLTADNVEMSADGVGEFGRFGGAGEGGLASVTGSLGATINVNRLDLFAVGEGGQGTDGGGDAIGGSAQIIFDGLSIFVLDRVMLDASALGGDADDGRGGSASGGSASIGINDDTSAFDVSGNTTLNANAVSGLSNSSSSGRFAQGGVTQVIINGEGTMDFGGSVFLSSDATGGDNEGEGRGGSATGGIADTNVINGGTLNIGADFQATATADGGNGIGGGNAFGGIAGMQVVDGSIDIVGSATTIASATGGDATSPTGFGGDGGDGIGGLALIQSIGTATDNGSLSIGGSASVLANGFGGRGGIGDGDQILAGNGGIGRGGNLDDLNPNDDFAQNGAFLLVGSDNASLTVNGTSLVNAVGVGGEGGAGGTEQDGGDGGDGLGGDANAGVHTFGGQGPAIGNGTATFADLTVIADGFGGAGGFGGSTDDVQGDGGDGIGNSAIVEAQGGSLNADDVSALANGVGGEGLNGGTGTGGDLVGLTLRDGASVSITGFLGSAQGVGGDGQFGGEGNGGEAIVSLDQSDLDMRFGQSGSIIQLITDARGGQGFDQVGDANAGSSLLLVEDSVLNADGVDLFANAFGSPSATGASSGEATAGVSSIVVNGDSTVDANFVSLITEARTTFGSDARGGVATIDLGFDGASGIPEVNLSSVIMDVDAIGGGDDSGIGNFAGEMLIQAFQGTLTIDDLSGTGAADILTPDPGPTGLIATGGDILINDTMQFTVFTDFLVETGQNSIVGGPSLAAPTADINILSEGTIIILGDDDNFIGFGGQSMMLTSRELDILDGARIGAVDLTLVSLDTDNPMFLGDGGGTVSFADTIGYELTQAEASRIDATNVTIQQPLVDNDGNDDPDIVIGNITAFGSLDDGVSNIFIEALGGTAIVRVEGQVDFVDTDITDTFTISAEGQIEIVTPGGIRVLNPAGDPGGALFLSSNNIWVGDSDLIALLQDDASFAGRNDQLRVAAAGSDDPLGYVRARQVSIEFADTFLVRNTGDSVEQGGILVGDGGLSIFGSDNSEGDLDAFAYGARLDSQGNLITGEDFFNEVNFNNDGSTGSVTYTDASEFNDCIINTGECPTTGPGPDPDPPVEPPVEPPSEGSEEVSIPLNNPNVIEGPIMSVSPIAAAPAVLDEEFGIDFPAFIAEPDEQDEEEIDDPVSSGGDSSIYGQGNSGSVEVEGN